MAQPTTTQYAKGPRGFSYSVPMSVHKARKRIRKALPCIARGIYDEYYRNIMAKSAHAPTSAIAMGKFVRESFPEVLADHNQLARRMNREIDRNMRYRYKATKFPILPNGEDDGEPSDFSEGEMHKPGDEASEHVAMLHKSDTRTNDPNNTLLDSFFDDDIKRTSPTRCSEVPHISQDLTEPGHGGVENNTTSHSTSDAFPHSVMNMNSESASASSIGAYSEITEAAASAQPTSTLCAKRTLNFEQVDTALDSLLMNGFADRPTSSHNFTQLQVTRISQQDRDDFDDIFPGGWEVGENKAKTFESSSCIQAESVWIPDKGWRSPSDEDAQEYSSLIFGL